MTTLSADEKRKILRGVALFSKLAEADIEAIAEVGTTRTVDTRAEVFHKGEAGQQLYVVVTGRLKVITTSDEGDDLIFCVAEPGDVVGEVALLLDSERTATVAALQPTVLIVIDRRDFRRLLESRPDVGLALLSVVAERLARLSQFVEDTHFLNLPVRLAKKLVELAQRHGRSDAGGHRIEIELELSQEEWGDLVGTTRESINKQFRTWTKQGLIALEGGRVVLLDRLDMEKLAGCVVL